MGNATAFTSQDDARVSRFSDEMFWAQQRKETKPGQDNSSGCTCPYCEQPLPHARANFFFMFSDGVRRLIFSVCAIIAAVFRCARFIVAGVLCFLGFIGSCCQAIGMRIAHPADRRLLKKR